MSNTELLASLVPSRHVVRAALHVASIVGQHPAALSHARESYWHHATGGTFSPADLRLGEQLLVDCDLVEMKAGALVATDRLRELLEGTLDDAVAIVCHSLLTPRAATPDLDAGSLVTLSRALGPVVLDDARRQELLLELGRLFDDARRSAIGAIGEDHVAEHCRRELHELGHDELARAVRRVSLVSDQLGYDVVAPRLDGPARLLEIKTAARPPQSEFEFFISRNEIKVGLATSDWALVACAVLDEQAGTAEIIGWCPAAALRDLLPTDAEQGHWTQAQLSIPLERLHNGLPRLVV
jgi:Domain of unknown function (DUF3883)